jgi:hypothetical protein
MNKNSYLKYLLFALTITLFASCDSDYNELGADIIGGDNFVFDKEDYPVNLTNQFIGASESKNLTVNPLGVYDSPVFGVTKANFVTQLAISPAYVNTTFDTALEPEIYSVVLYVPLFATKTVAETATTLATYTLDSISGPSPKLAAPFNTFSKFKLDVYESKYFIRDVNPVDQLSQAYYNDNSDFAGANIGTDRLNIYGEGTADQSQNDKFTFSPLEYVDMDSTKTLSTVYTVINRSPALKLNLKRQFFIDKILHAPADKLANNNIFKDYFRGIYFKATQIAGEKGNLAMLNFAKGKIVINYRQFASATNHTQVLKRFALDMTGNTISMIEQGTPPVVPDPANVVIKGGANNSMAVVDLFDPYDPSPTAPHTKLKEFRAKKQLINDAALTFTIVRGSNGMDRTNGDAFKAAEPLRLYLYDLNNKKPIADYSLDASTNSIKPKFGRKAFDGIIRRESGSEKRGETYKIKITKHIMQLIANDTVTNVRLGLVVTEDINNSSSIRIKNPVANLIPAGTLKVIPTMSSIHPFGTIIYGSDIPLGDPNYDKRPKFEIYYTKPK